MSKKWGMRLFSCMLAGAYIVLACANLQAAPQEKVAGDERCSVCGMFVAKYDNWIVQIRLTDDRILFFDGVKDMLVFYFDPKQYSSSEQQEIREIWVRDYYSLRWLAGRDAWYVVGSDVYGPMGKEFIPLASREAAENFKSDHRGEKILAFDEITEELVQSLRTGTRMRHSDR